ncbi:dTDP-4-dehydrorhamnose reductase [Virgibacillus subterraneus]|uniref:dTDP-4-dehydrorhamnose reductase n=1 Tax=Virgibacillus subterraneus TaxID=621109 RepID=A0A1H9A4B2_9BACI|nr:sugar nucleotide-binding protein [Virgibacillus subterraneus]SEP71297.1 dTDP-4-dehydrorhamnose reductase [Virgibacillus subterraneus]
MKVCVFGASGYTGASIYQLLKDTRDFEVVGTFLREPTMFDDLYKLDINQPESFSDFFKKAQPDVVVWSVMSGPNEHELVDQGLMHLITHLTPQTKLVYISSDFVFAEGKGSYNEDDPMSKLPDDHLLANYANAKVKAERFITKELSNYAILRAGPIYGENKIGKLDERTDKLSYHLRSDKRIAFRDDLIRTFVYVDDLANVVVELVQNEVTGVYHVGPNKSQSLYEFMRQKAEEFGYDMNLVEKESEEEVVNQEVPKNTSLNTKKIKKITKQKFH